jgi:prephenate dehydratase
LEIKMQIGYLGPLGTFSEEAATKYVEREQIKNPVYIPFPSFFAVGQAVLDRQVDVGILPVENSLEGQVGSPDDILIAEDRLFGCAEVVLPVRIHLSGKDGMKMEQATRIYSHPQPFGQCAAFIHQYFPTLQQITSASTSQAVADMLMSPEPALALSNERAAMYYGATILRRDVQDNSANETRFLAVGLADHAPTGDDKTSICFTLPADKPGILYLALKPFAQADINFTRIESRPTKERLGRYVFLLDLKGHRQDRIIAQALAQLQQMTHTFRIIGSYPIWIG